MTDARKLRATTGYTHEKQSADAELWFKKAVAFHEAASILYEAGERLSDGVAIVAFNYAISLELIFKAITVAEGNKIAASHKLNNLCVKANVDLNDNQRQTLDLLTAIAEWRGRYPVPKNAGTWDDYIDNILEKHRVRRKSGNVYATGVNLKTWPTEGNYKKIWDACKAKYKGAIRSP